MGNVLKLAFVGSVSVGKTTLIDGLRSIYEGKDGVVFVEEAARIYLENNKYVDRSVPDPHQAIHRMQFDLEKDAHDKNPNLIICDRSVIDSAMFIKAIGYDSVAQIIIDNSKEWLQTYDKIYLLDPSDIPHQHDDVRTEDFEFRKMLHDIFLESLESNDIKYELLSGSHEQRVTKVKNYLKSKSI